jgi:SAM-dependent methyltransferase
MSHDLDAERAHENAWHARAIGDRFFDREGFRRLIDWNLAALKRQVPITRDTRVLSIGCGAGEYELRLARGAGTVVGVDLSEVAVAEAHRRAASAGLTNLRFECGAVDAVTFPDASFDLVMAFGVLHHLDAGGRSSALARAHRWLSPGGWFYARDPNRRGLLRRVAGGLARRGGFHSPNEEALDPAGLLSEISAAGFTGARLDYTDVVAGPLPWVTASRSSLLWATVFAFDRAWLATPGLRSLASQFAIVARR